MVIAGTVLAAGSLAATAVRAQESNAGTQSSATGQNATGQSKQSNEPPYGAYVNNSHATPDADGVPVANPNPYSRFMKEDKDEPPVETPLVDPPDAPEP
jgi:hypothetical protein